MLVACAATPAGRHAIFTGEATRFAPGIVSTQFSDIRLTISHVGRTALWFSRYRPGGAGGYDIWVA
ncbi:MAG: hypothetical protein H7Y89_02900, partial [Steroidobacteraceae bacterium]|nr:hypothetical protein [Steroidobacteraceae bacterium]